MIMCIKKEEKMLHISCNKTTFLESFIAITFMISEFYMLCSVDDEVAIYYVRHALLI